MKEFFSRLGVYIASLAGVAYAFQSPGVVSIVAAFCAVIGYLALDVWWYWVRKVTPHDLELFTRFREVLPSDCYAVERLRDFDFANDFEIKHFEPLKHFIRKWATPESQFHNAELNEVFQQFLGKLGVLRGEFGLRTAPNMDGSGLQTSRIGTGSDYSSENELRSIENAKVLNDLAGDVFELHQKVMETGIKVLRYQVD